MSTELDILHRRATIRRGPSYDERKRRWVAYHELADMIAARLPFKWHAMAMDNPTQNHTGTTNGANHIVLDEAFTSGRLKRQVGDTLCGVGLANLFTPADTGPTCKRCLELAERYGAQTNA